MADRAAPTPVAMLIGTAIIAGLSGYMLGIFSSLGFLPIPFSASKSTPKPRGIAHYDDEEESSEEEVDVKEAGVLDHAPNWGNALKEDKRDGLRVEQKEEKKAWEDSQEECKLVLVVRTDLGMTKGISLSYYLIL